MVGIWRRITGGTERIARRTAQQDRIQTTAMDSFAELDRHLEAGRGATFVHHWHDPSHRRNMPQSWAENLPPGWDLPGASGTSEAPKYLYRGEPGLYPSTLPSLGRAFGTERFSGRERDLLTALIQMTRWAANARIADPLRAYGWTQHYGIPTPFIDLTSDPSVAEHFAADLPGPAPDRCVVYRLDLERLEPLVYGAAGRPVPLVAVGLSGTYFTRAMRQSAYMIAARNDAPTFDLQGSGHLRGSIERFEVKPVDAERFVRPDLLSSADDMLASWPLATLRALKTTAGGGLPRRLATWLCDRLPLYEWTPLQILYDGRGRGSSLRPLSPADAERRDGVSYAADRAAVVEELCDPEIPVPNGIVFGAPTGGPPGTSRWLEPGEECEVQYTFGIDAPPGSDSPLAIFPHSFARIPIR